MHNLSPFSVLWMSYDRFIGQGITKSEAQLNVELQQKGQACTAPESQRLPTAATKFVQTKKSSAVPSV